MAEKIALDIQISTLNSAESIGALKNGIKELTKELEKLPEGSEQFKNTAAAIGNAKDKLADLNEEVVQTTTKAGKFQAVLGVGQQIANGFQLAQSAMALFGSESEAVTQALQKAQAAMQFVQGLKELEGIGDAMKNAKVVILDFAKNGITALRSLWATMLANPITAILIGLSALAAGIAYLVTRESESTKAIKENIEERKKQEKEIAKKFDNEIKLAKAAGKEVTDLELKKLKAVEDNLKAQEQEFKNLAKSKGELNEDEAKEYQELQDKLLAATTDRTVKELEIEREKNKKLQEYNNERENAATRLMVAKMSDRNKELYDLEQKQQEEIKKLGTLQQVDSEKEYAEYQKSLNDINSFYNLEKSKVNKKYNEIEKEAREKREAEELAKRTKTYEDDINAIQIKIGTENKIQEEGLKFSDDIDAFWKAKMDERDKYYDEKKAERQKLRSQMAVELTQQTLQLTADIATAFAKDDEASQKKAFEINKKVQLALATIEMIKGVQSAFTSAQASPYTAVFPGYPYIQAAMAAAYGIMNIRKISQTQFEGGGGGAAGGMEGAAGGAGGAMSAPLQGGVNNTSTMLENLGQGQQEQKPIKAYVLQTDVASEDQKIKAIENKSKIE